jgi:hypothetical protein
MPLTLMVRLVPGDDVQHVEERELAVLEELVDRAQVLVAEPADRGEQVLA